MRITYDVYDNNNNKIKTVVTENIHAVNTFFREGKLYVGASYAGCTITNIEDDISSAAAELGRKGGSSRSWSKIQAARENGRKGGRPPRKE